MTEKMLGYLCKTESGSTYWVSPEHAFWARNSDGLARIWAFKTLPDPFEWEEGKFWEKVHSYPSAEAPVLGERLYLASRDAWYVSSAVVEIQEDVEYDRS